MSAAGEPRLCGVFFLASMQLALPLDALREVLPCTGLVALPCAAPSVIGGIDLREVLVPVLDLRRALGLEIAGDEPRSVVIMVHEGRLLGLLASGVVGVLACPPGAWNEIGARNAEAPVLGASFRRNDDATLVSVLSPEGLVGLRDVPTVADPEPARRSVLGITEGSGGDAAVAAESCLMLVRSGPVPLALASDAVHTTVLHPEILASPLTSAYCLGVIEFAGTKVPAVDLLALCGLGSLPDEGPTQAFLVRYARGLVAFIVEEIIDVVRADSRAAVPIPANTLPREEFFAGVLALDALPREVQQSGRGGIGYYLVLDPQALVGAAALEGLARMNTPMDGDAFSTSSLMPGIETAHAERCRVLTYDVGFEVATPIGQIAEILPWVPETAIFATEARATGLVMSRGRAIPTFSLAALIGVPEGPRSPTACILVIELDDDSHVGFTVQGLRAIDDAPSERLKALDEQASGPGSAASNWTPALVGSGPTERMLSVLDLKCLARLVRNPAEGGTGYLRDVRRSALRAAMSAPDMA